MSQGGVWNKERNLNIQNVCSLYLNMSNFCCIYINSLLRKTVAINDYIYTYIIKYTMKIIIQNIIKVHTHIYV